MLKNIIRLAQRSVTYFIYVLISMSEEPSRWRVRNRRTLVARHRN